MHYVMDNIEAEKLPGEIQRRRIPSSQRIRVVVETLDNDLPLASF